MSEEDYLYYKDVLDNNKTGLDTLDKKIYPKMFGYKDWIEYYKYCSMGDNIGKIEVPTFGLNSVDDMMFPDWTTPRSLVSKKGSNIILAVSDFGSHVCYVTGTLIPSTWYPDPCLRFIEFLEEEKQLAKKNN